ncbi:TraR/DksA family transcriptional regulator [Paraoerskovia marina]|uniref:TraR/DksA family transcriptional regulator n=1 Tax=Paraoerskovia marina TaxID=545619 RepID=UPI0004927C6E|nr:TraR/DksA C4-type zinc finger protein [Paraoerskovia marina]
MNDSARARLLELRATTLLRGERLRGDVHGMVEASRTSNADDEHDPEGSTIAFERAQTAALASQADTDLAEIDAAIARLDDGTYGICEACGREIAPARLEARPTARSCIACA